MLNIPINKFSVPKRDEEESPDPFVWSGVWSSFVRTLCGIPELDGEQRTAPVHTLCVPMSLDLDDFAALCSALAEARTVKHLLVYLRDNWRSIFDIMEGEDPNDEDVDEGEEHSDSDGGSDNAAQDIAAEGSQTSEEEEDDEESEEEMDNDDMMIPKRMCKWLAFGLFSKTSSTSIESLSLEGFAFGQAPASILREVITASDPVGVMLQHVRRFESLSPTERTTIRLPAGADLKPITWGRRAEALKIAAPVEAIVLGTGSLDESTRFVFVPGHGFCRTEYVYRSNKRTRRDPEVSVRPTSAVKALYIKTHRDDTTSKPALLPVLELIGSSLIAVRVKMPNIDEDFVRRVLSSSPGLQHLTLGNATLPTMAALDAAYDAGLPLHSLVLKACEIPEPELNTFLEKLSDPHHVVGKRLQQLRLGKDWRANLSEQTVQQLRTVLE